MPEAPVPAPLAVRAQAGALDLLVWVAISVIYLNALGVDEPNVLQGSVLVVLLLLSSGAQELWTQTTLGKRALRLRVVAINGAAPSALQVLIRTVLRIADGIPGMYLLGLAVAASTPRVQRIGDFLGRTIVVQDPPRVR